MNSKILLLTSICILRYLQLPYKLYINLLHKDIYVIQFPSIQQS